MESIIKIENVTKKYSNKLALSIDNLVITKGESFGLVGNNGAGKTTLFRLILDLIESDSGVIKICDDNVSKTESWKFNVASFLDETFLFDFLTPLEYFKFLAELHKVETITFEERLSELLEFVNDKDLIEKKFIRELSKGNKQKVGIISSLISKPQIVILDEPFSNLDPSSQIKLKKIIKNYNKNEKITFLISSHDLIHITEICDRIVLLEEGEIKKDIETSNETFEELKKYFEI